MGQIFERLIYRFNTDNNEFAEEHFTPREVIRLMVRLLLEDEDALTNPNAIITIIARQVSVLITGIELSRLNSSGLKPFQGYLNTLLRLTVKNRSGGI
ncbi:MAG: SAM-dependent DNA methyltransferase [Synechococcales cyanobacterium T60_A2020_003]|nr:SAM-dependent DNA methyltransferase [Synechococcales cyanobacterium T60_A2020_003]